MEQRDAEVKRRRGTQRSGDVVEISPAARNLGTQTVSSADLASVKDVRQARVEEVRRRVESGFYDRPEVRQAVAEAVLNSGVVEPAVEEARQIRTAKSELGDVPDVRSDRVEAAKQRVASNHYGSTGTLSETASKVLDALVG